MSKQVYNIECLKCKTIDDNGCCDEGSYVVFDGLKLTKNNIVTLIHAPYTIESTMDSVILTSAFKGSVTISLEETVFTSIVDLKNYLGVCKCTSGGTESIPEFCFKVIEPADTYEDLNVVDQTVFTIPAPVDGDIDLTSILFLVNGKGRAFDAPTHGYTYVVNSDGSITFTLSEHVGEIDDPCKVEIFYNICKEICIGG